MIFLFQRILSDYNVPIFRKLNEILQNSLILIHGQPARRSYFLDNREETLPFKIVRLKNLWFKGEAAVWQNFWEPFKVYNTPRTVIMEHSLRILSLFPLYFYCKVKSIPFILWGHGGSRKRSVSSSLNIIDIIHRWLIGKADAYVCYSDGIREELLKITKQSKLFVARNTLDTTSLFTIRRKLEIEGKDSVKQMLGLNRKYYICFIGRLFPGKRVDYLIEVFELVKREESDTGLLIIGDGPEKTSLYNYVLGKRLRDVRFLGGIADWNCSGYYLYASDVMVMPGDIGLSVNHAFCFGLPVITQAPSKKGPFHGPEIEYITHGETGFICQNGNKEKMSEDIIRVFKNQAFFNEKVTMYCRKNLSIDEMVQGFKSAIEFVTSYG